jgi:outer membrane protein assembly factor BamB
VGRGGRRGIRSCIVSAGLIAAIAFSVSACSGPLAGIKNPFKKEKERLPGERIAVIADPSMVAIEPKAAGKPIQIPPPQANAAWSEPGGTPSNNLGHLALGDQLQKAWTADAGTGSSSSGRLSAVPLVADGKVFTLDAGGRITAFSAANGAKLWAASVTPDNVSSRKGFGGGLALDGGHLYVTTGYGTVVGIDSGNGAILWTKSFGGPIRSSPTAVGGKIYFVSTDNVLYALSAADGQQLWTARGLPQPATLLSNVSPAVSSGTVVAPFPAGDIGAYDAASGKAAWTDSLTRSSETTAAGVLADPARPVIDHGVVYAVSHGGKMVAVSETTGERLWSRNLASSQMPWVAGDTIYAVDLGGKLIALSRSDGEVRWATDLPTSTRWSGPVLAGGKLWLISGEGVLVGADARTGQIATNLDLDTAVFISPVVAGGHMYILADNATLIALN